MSSKNHFKIAEALGKEINKEWESGKWKFVSLSISLDKWKFKRTLQMLERLKKDLLRDEEYTYYPEKVENFLIESKMHRLFEAYIKDGSGGRVIHELVLQIWELHELMEEVQCMIFTE